MLEHEPDCHTYLNFHNMLPISPFTVIEIHQEENRGHCQSLWTTKESTMNLQLF